MAQSGTYVVVATTDWSYRFKIVSQQTTVHSLASNKYVMSRPAHHRTPLKQLSQDGLLYQSCSLNVLITAFALLISFEHSSCQLLREAFLNAPCRQTNALAGTMINVCCFIIIHLYPFVSVCTLCSSYWTSPTPRRDQQAQMQIESDNAIHLEANQRHKPR